MAIFFVLLFVVNSVQARCLCFMPKHLQEQQQKIVVTERVEVPVTVTEHKETVIETIKETRVEQQAPQVVTTPAVTNNTVTEKVTIIEKSQESLPGVAKENPKVLLPRAKPGKKLRKKRSPQASAFSYAPAIAGAIALGAICYFAGRGANQVPPAVTGTQPATPQPATPPAQTGLPRPSIQIGQNQRTLPRAPSVGDPRDWSSEYQNLAANVEQLRAEVDALRPIPPAERNGDDVFAPQPSRAVPDVPNLSDFDRSK